MLFNIIFSLNLFGAIKTDSLGVKNSFNGRSQKEFNDLYAFEKDSNYHIVHADVSFHHPTNVAYLNTPYFNGKDVYKWMEGLIKIYDRDITVLAPKAFKRDLMVENGLFIDTLNGHNLREIIKNILTINGDVNIYGDLIFEEDLNADVVALRGNLSTDNVNGCFLKDWMHYHKLATDKNIIYNGKA